MSGSESDRWGSGQSRYGAEGTGEGEPAGNSVVHPEPVPDQNIARLADAVGQLQSRLDQVAEELSTMQSHVQQTGINTEEAITAALEDILARLDRGVETTADQQQEHALAQMQEAVSDLVARSDRDTNDPTRAEDVRPHLARIENTVNELAGRSQPQSEDVRPHLDRIETAVRELAVNAELGQDTLEAVTRIESVVAGLADEGRYERRSVVVRLDQLLEAVQAGQASQASQPSQADGPGAGDRDLLLGKIDRLAEQVESLRRRIALPATPEPVKLDASSVSAVGEAVTGALAAALTGRISTAPGRTPGDQDADH